MARVLVWNINNFSLPKIRTPPGPPVAPDRLNYILNQVLQQNPPDIIAIIEVCSRVREISYEGLTARGRAGQGARALLADLRAAAPFGAQWCLVPPICNGSEGVREAIAVYYNSATVQFVGPYLWTGPGAQGFSRARPPTAGFPMQPYDPLWAAGMPGAGGVAARDVPPAVAGFSLPNAAPPAPAAPVPEACCAAQWEFFNPPGTRLFFPLPNPLGLPNTSLSRGPQLLTFLDPAPAAGAVGPVGPPSRILKFFFVHTSPGYALQAVNNFPQIAELAPQANEVSILAGDFNLDTSAFNPLQPGGPWDALFQPPFNFTMLLNPQNPPAPAVGANPLVPYCQTHMHVQGMPYGILGHAPDRTHGPYPQFGYMDGALDNVLVAYGAGLAPPAPPPVANNPNGITIANLVVGTPYNADPAPPPALVNNALVNGLAYPRQMANPLPVPAGVREPPPALLGAQLAAFLGFRNWNNFGRIYNTSDHLALYAVV